MIGKKRIGKEGEDNEAKRRGIKHETQNVETKRQPEPESV